ncbi:MULTISPECIES: saccharopine dehydrogenase family protein [Mycobacterium]|uniref:Saccharopine dehydrogenase n=1 Tax=Mycobacterium kiyosense TaxID=2871094 RepID=A0A9P3Q3D8_9MYCO|nr:MULTISPECIES: saccharopine dehydrogenase NADP-binding domain-containing protein [Mycobacterium]BDB44063.1 saccharopine dehydrogenase [Mycobacterium kiyosense]BDE15599.1 saccharopine dehydrogenase [Mycobacterium sp. 20KCMC460]GLB80978.1 saccharopine dehydrogenase [Mycobacterium kiyosense]GLB87262.1 saccharopine dehydrogenase [Mycobacterium kiyosense]GLB93458.1 saccharopine dehydrogenase [Mycobacterium kiyosense]
MARIVLLGATGYTGRLIAERLAKQTVETILAGRSPAALAALADELGGACATAVVRLDDPRTLRTLLRPGDVLLTTVGPFIKVGDVALDAAIACGAHYIDTTGEAPFVRQVFENPSAQKAAGALVTAMGFNYSPGNLAGALAMEQAAGSPGGPVDALEIGYFLTGPGRGELSRGTVASAAGVLTAPGFAWRGGRLVTERCGARTRAWPVSGRSVPSMTLGSSEAITLPQAYPKLDTVDVYQGGLGAATPVVAQVGRLAALPGARWFADTLSGLVKYAAPIGPDDTARARAGTYVVAVAYSRAGHVLSEVTLQGPDVYDVTADLTAWAAERAAAGEVRGHGPLGPVQAFGLDELREGHQAAGMVVKGAQG